MRRRRKCRINGVIMKIEIIADFYFFVSQNQQLISFLESATCLLITISNGLIGSSNFLKILKLLIIPKHFSAGIMRFLPFRRKSAPLHLRLLLHCALHQTGNRIIFRKVHLILEI